MKPKEVIILAGGQGSRLINTVPGIPKVMAPVAGHPFIHYVLEYLIEAGIQRFIFALGKQHEPIEAYLNQQYADLERSIVTEDEPLGTGGAILNAIGHSTENTVAVTNGDTFFMVKLDNISGFHHMCGAECTIALKAMKSFSRYGEVVVNKDYTIAAFNEKKVVSEGLINGGFYILNKRLWLQNELPVQFSFEEDYLGKMYKDRRIYGVPQDGYFIDIGVPEDFFKAQEDFMQNL
jgi:D-glycero-alpha-D-manno-heptose 1-phosphate guanylyltransferase